MRWICSTENQFWKEMIPADTAAGETLTVSEPQQSIRGFGGCFNELGYTSLLRLDAEQRKEIMKDLFSPEACGFRFCRLPIGANDFSLDWYSLDDTPGDYELNAFSIERDRQYLIPYIREAQHWMPELELFASPWSPPTWMKTPPVYNYGRLNPDEKTLDAYARYFLRFLQEYEKEGIRIQRICPQNEVFADQKFPSCLFSGELMRDFIRDHLGPRLEQESPETEIWLGTINGPSSDFIYGNWHCQNYNTFTSIVLKDAKARSYIRGAALQWGGKHVLNQLRLSYPDLPIFQSECECGDGKNAYIHFLYLFELMWIYFQMGAEAFVYWNISLNETAESTWGWKQNSLITVDQHTGEWHYNPEYYLMKHISAFVPAGSRLMTTKGGYTANALCFKRPDDTYTFLLLNPFDTQETITLSCEKATRSFSLPPKSLSTILMD